MVKLTKGTLAFRNKPGSWKKPSETDLSEVAVRVNAPAMTFDRRGDLVYWDDFEDSSYHFQDQITPASGGLTNRTTTNPKFGDFCFRFVTGGVIDNYCAVYYVINDFHVERVGTEISFASQSVNSLLFIHLVYFDGTNRFEGKVAYDTSSSELLVWSGGVWVTAATLPGFHGYAGERIPYDTLKMVVDLSTGNYVRALFFGVEVDLTGWPMETALDATARGVVTYIFFQTLAAAAQTAYIDDFKFTVNEPE